LSFTVSLFCSSFNTTLIGYSQTSLGAAIVQVYFHSSFSDSAKPCVSSPSITFTSFNHASAETSMFKVAQGATVSHSFTVSQLKVGHSAST